MAEAMKAKDIKDLDEIEKFHGNFTRNEAILEMKRK